MTELPPNVRKRIEVVDGHWLWTGSLNADGYGQIELPHRKHWLAHRLVWSLLVAGELPENLHHLCAFKRCVRPACLEPLTASEHTMTHTPKRTHCKNGHPFDDDNTYWRSGRTGASRQCRACKAATMRRAWAKSDGETKNALIAERTARRRRQRASAVAEDS